MVIRYTAEMPSRKYSISGAVTPEFKAWWFTSSSVGCCIYTGQKQTRQKPFLKG
jgi:hypothetical protein